MNPLDPWGAALGGHNRLRVQLPEDVPAYLLGQPFDLPANWPQDARAADNNPLWDVRGPGLAQQDDLPLSLFGNDLAGPGGNFYNVPGQRVQSGEHGDLDDQEARQRAKLQEKNRKAQKRFRERQKTKFAGLTQKVEELEARLSILMQEKAQLEDRMLVLEKASGTPITTSLEGTSSAALSPTTSRMPLNKEDAFVDEASGNQEGSEYLFQDNLVLEVPGEGPVALSPDAIKKLTSREVQDMYQKYVLAMKGWLEKGTCDGVLCSPITARGVQLVRLVWDLSALLVRVVALNPIVSRQMHQEDNPCTPLSIKQNIELNLRIARVLQLSKEQRESLVQTVNAFRHRLGGILKERQDTISKMQPQLQQRADMGPGSETAIDGFLLTTEGTISLKESLRKEHWEVLNLLTRCFRITNVVQTAIFMVESHPRWFDYIALASAVASDDASEREDSQSSEDPLDPPEQAIRQDPPAGPSRHLRDSPIALSSSPPDRAVGGLAGPQEGFTRQGSSGSVPDVGRGRSSYGQHPARGPSPPYTMGGRGRSSFLPHDGRGPPGYPQGSGYGPAGYPSRSGRGGQGYQ